MELQLQPYLHLQARSTGNRLKLKLHTTEVGGVYFSKDAGLSRLKLKYHAAKAGGDYLSKDVVLSRLKLKYRGRKPGSV